MEGVEGEGFLDSKSSISFLMKFLKNLSPAAVPKGAR